MFEHVQNFASLLSHDLPKFERKQEQRVLDRGNNPSVGF